MQTQGTPKFEFVVEAKETKYTVKGKEYSAYWIRLPARIVNKFPELRAAFKQGKLLKVTVEVLN